MRNHLIAEITKEAETNPNIVFLTGDLGYNVVNKFYDEFPARFINCGISEQNMTSVAAGLALEGKCVFTYSIGNFSTLRCIEQIRNDICYHNANVKIIALAAGFPYGALGMSHHATEDIACMRSLPNMTVFSPCDPLETMAVAKAAISINTPCYIRIGRGGEPNIHDSFDNFQIGKAYKLYDGNDGVILSTGAITIEAVKAVQELKKEGINITLYSFPTIKPIDKDLIISLSKKFSIIYTLEEHNKFGGFGSAISEVVAQIPGNRACVKMIALDDEYTSIVGDCSYLRHYYHLDAESIVTKIKG